MPATGRFTLLIPFFLLFSIVGVLVITYSELEKLDNANDKLQELLLSLSDVNIRIQSLLIDEYVQQRAEEWKISREDFSKKLQHFSKLPTILAIKDKHSGFTKKEMQLSIIMKVNQEDAKVIEDDLLILFESGDLEEFDTLQSFKTRTGEKITLLIENIRSFHVLKKIIGSIFNDLASIINTEISNKKQNIQYLGITIIGLLLLVALILLVFWGRTIVKKQALVDEKNKELRRIDKIKDSFLANTSHELRTPLSGIIGLSESLLAGSGGPVTSEQSNDLKMIIEGGKRLSKLINHILDFSKMKHHDIEVDCKPLDMHFVAETVISISRPLVNSKNVTLTNSIAPDTPAVSADENRVQQILYNLIGNAIKFTETGIIEVTAKTKDTILEISVTDTGVGLSEENLVSVFQPFEQADTSDAREHGGTGLGLAITKQLIELHGGTIRVESTIGKGSKFTFTLLLAKKKAEPAQFSPEISTIRDFSELNLSNSEHSYIAKKVIDPDTPFQILIVDDDPTNLKVLSNHLSLKNYSCIQASSGQEALDLIHKHGRPNLVILDVMMPKLSGFDVCRKLRENHPANELPIIFITAKNLITDLAEGFFAGANDYLTKPFSKQELLARVATHLEVSEKNQVLIRTKIELDKTNSSLKESEERFRLIFENNPISIWLEDFSGVMLLFEDLKNRGITEIGPYFEDHPEVVQNFADAVKITDINQASLLLHKASSKQQLLDDLSKTFTPESYKVFQEELVSLWNGETSFSSEAIVKTLDQQPRHVAISNRIVPGCEQSLSKIIVSMSDITEQKKLEAQLHQSQKMESLGTMAGGIAHEFNNILAIMLGNIELLISAGKEAPQLKERLAIIYDVGLRAADLVKQILLFSRKETVEIQQLNPIPIIKQTLNIIRSTTPANIEINSNLQEDCGEILTNNTQLHQVLLNLVHNASQSLSEKSGKIWVTASKLFAGDLPDSTLDSMSSTQATAYFCLTVEDTGCGIQADHLHQIFDPFFTTKEPGEGTGMGLSMVHSIIESQGGTMAVDTELGKGTTFSIFLPITTIKTPENIPAFEHFSRKTQEAAILIVEDQPELSELYKDYLEEYGYKITVSNNGLEAFELFKIDPDQFDLVVSDVQMPKMTGNQLADALLKIRPSLPIILSSGYRNSESNNTIAACKYLSKPVKLTTLLKEIDECLSNKS